MQNVEQAGRPITPPALELLPEGAFCDTTRRIVIVSPYPAHLQDLVSELMAQCYDVLLFRLTKEQALPPIVADLLIIDRTWGIDTEVPVNSAADILYLIGDRTSGPLPDEEAALHWPSSLDFAVRRIEELAGKEKPLDSSALSAHPERIHFKDIEIDPKRMVVWHSGSRVDLTKTEYDLLRLLITSEGVLSRQDIMEAIWGDGYFGGSNSIDVHIKSLRHKLGDDPKQPSYIATVRGVGYRLAD
ncbi:winged helix-turn-helix domain-containing protein [Cohnella lubricantis]|uniref:Winged helix-turn-helix domain-containing protein n=1 Tax=Cohnella lubricantis TaxID=2163172 RepID=A0A841T525_9BACL|nr:winged helix-turn-helix domain-containing protein [Cohnella lubricantis]MBB6676643.1 winged helix-turn-helix domain-containing protein [Cohnella lubricantis]MBP2120439.1 two-component system alkaline phosphatase synthesis response regulator PhoP [Cohnella lubricantis]